MLRKLILLLLFLLVSCLCYAADTNVTAIKIWIGYSNGEHDLITGSDIQNSSSIIKDDSSYNGPEILNVTLANPKGSVVTSIYYYETAITESHASTGWLVTTDGSTIAGLIDQETPPLQPSSPYALNYLQQGGITSVDINSNNRITTKQYAISTGSGTYKAITPTISNQ